MCSIHCSVYIVADLGATFSGPYMFVKTKCLFSRSCKIIFPDWMQHPVIRLRCFSPDAIFNDLYTCIGPCTVLLTHW